MSTGQLADGDRWRVVRGDMATATFACKWCGWPAGPGCVGCLAARVEEERPPGPRRFFDRTGRELPVDADGRPMCPHCAEWKFVAVTRLGAYCTWCCGDVGEVEPKKHLPDF